MKSRYWRILIFLAGIIFALGWFYISERVTRSKTYEGHVVEKYTVRKWILKGKKVKVLYYIVVRTDDGRTLEVQVPYQLYSKLEEGDRVIKKKGQPYPLPAYEVEESGPR